MTLLLKEIHSTNRACLRAVLHLLNEDNIQDAQKYFGLTPSAKKILPDINLQILKKFSEYPYLLFYIDNKTIENVNYRLQSDHNLSNECSIDFIDTSPITLALTAYINAVKLCLLQDPLQLKIRFNIDIDAARKLCSYDFDYIVQAMKTLDVRFRPRTNLFFPGRLKTDTMTTARHLTVATSTSRKLSA